MVETFNNIKTEWTNVKDTMVDIRKTQMILYMDIIRLKGKLRIIGQWMMVK